MKTRSAPSFSRLALAAALLSAPALAYAAGSTTSFNVQASVASTCTVNALPLNFGAFDPSLGTPLTGSTTINVFCTRTTPFTVALDAGVNGGSFSASRTMKEANGQTLNYNLYTSAAGTSVWGDGTASSATVTGTGAGASTAVPLPVFGRIPAQPLAVPSGSYSDTVTVTITY